MRWRFSVLAILFLAGLAPSAVAQETGVETVTVVADARGPAIWHATRAGADVAILAIVQPLPDHFAWNTIRLERTLSGARRVLLPPRVQMGVFSGVWFLLTKRDLLHPPEGKTLTDILDPRVAAELEKTCDFLHETKDRYSDNSPVLAATRLGSDFRHVALLTTHEPEDSITALARSQHVPVHRIASYDLIPSGEELLKLPPTVTGRCIEAVIRDIDFQSQHVEAAAEAWALGDVAGMMANWSAAHLNECLIGLSPHATALDARSINDTVGAIDDAIAGGGHTLVVVDVGLLMRKGGVRDRLKAQGVSVTDP